MNTPRTDHAWATHNPSRQKQISQRLETELQEALAVIRVLVYKAPNGEYYSNFREDFPITQHVQHILDKYKD